jgi:hypothetical protein
MKFAKFSPELTKAAGFKCPAKKARGYGSKIGIRADGSLRYDLAGKDKSDLRDKVFERDKYHCADMMKWIGGPFPGLYIENAPNPCEGPLEMSHWPPMSKSEGSDEMKTCFCRCRKHHRLLDNREVRWTPRVEVAE